MVQNQRDPETPLVGACALRGALGGRARMVTADLRGAVPTPSVRAPAQRAPGRRSFCRGTVSHARPPPSGFPGVPYAALPLGAYRMRSPQPVVPWRGVRAVARTGPTVRQGKCRLPCGVPSLWSRPSRCAWTAVPSRPLPCTHCRKVRAHVTDRPEPRLVWPNPRATTAETTTVARAGRRPSPPYPARASHLPQR
ncbi:alpha/beta hydrolase [Streptomyces parvus]|uniref:alpha/beta hydrolase n=1 Tax=Streptomyces parvus TaxID=66428 RepID=UPI00382C0CEB